MVAPLIAAAAIGGATSLIGGLISGASASKAAKYQLQATREQIAAANQNRDYQYSLNAPSISLGDSAQGLYAGFLGAGDNATDYGAYVRNNPDILAEYQRVANTGEYSDIDAFGRFHYDKYGQGEGRNLPTAGGGSGEQSAAALSAFRDSTGYQDLLREGLGATNANAYARGQGDSGATLKALQDRGTSIANQSSQQWLGNLGTLINNGNSARGLVAGVGASTVANNNAATQSGADARSNAALQTGATWNSNIQNLLNAGAYAYGSSFKPNTGYPINGR